MKKTNNYTQMPLSALEQSFSRWHQLLECNQSGNIFSLQKSGMLPRIIQFIEWRKANYHRDTTLLDLDLENLTDPYSLKNKLDQIKGDVIIITRDHFLNHNALSLEPILQRHYAEGSINFLLIHECAPHQLLSFNNHTALLYANHQIFATTLDREQLRIYIKNTCDLWQIQSPDDHIFNQIVDYCSNQPWLINEYLRLIEDKAHTDLDTIEQSSSLTYRANTILKSLPSKYLTFLSNQKEDKSIAQEMSAFGLIDSSLKPTGTWLTQAIARHNSSRLVIDRGKIFLDNVDISLNFTSKEKRLFTFFLNPQAIVSFETLGLAIYAGVSDYSDWALSQTISRFRSKLLQYNLPLKIKTKRGKGYEFIRE
ncbi:MAG: helix-turn-helix domain-containing protein [Candidatus Moraniibacteriota bacterium]|nr:MAG: helix-turn-helix domain-containing protein [Candidatus Moranbacteria bacterium]